jgi:hypothetical protein
MASSSRQNLPAEYTDEWGVTWVKLDNCDGYVQEANLPYQKKKERAFQRQREYQMQQQHQQQQASAAASTGSDITREWWRDHWKRPNEPAAVPPATLTPAEPTFKVDLEPDNAPALCSKTRAIDLALYCSLFLRLLLFYFCCFPFFCTSCSFSPGAHSWAIALEKLVLSFSFLPLDLLLARKS